MASKPDSLTVGAWVAKDIPHKVSLVRFMLPEDHYQTLLSWAPQSKKPGMPQYSNVVLAGLSEILAFFVPEVSFMDSQAKNSAGQPRLAIYLLEAPSDLQDIRLRAVSALNFWLANLYPDKPAEMRTAVANSANDDAQWQSLSVSTLMKTGDGVCAVPEDPLVFSALAALAAQKLSGTEVRFTSGETKTWIAQTPQSGTYEGIELVAFPPKFEPNANALFSEVVTLKTATFPERVEQGIHILAHASIRNWGPIRGYDVSSSPSRSLDLFMPQSGAQPSDYKRYGHSRIRYKALVENWDGVRYRGEEKDIQAKWGSKRDRSVFEIVRQLTGTAPLSNADFMAPVQDYDGAWVLPRLAPGSGDRYLAGGSGVGWSDRSDISGSLDTPLAEIGFVRAGDMRRIIGQLPIKTDFASGGEAAGRRRQLLHAMSGLGISSALTFLVLSTRDRTPTLIEEELVKLLGVPDRKKGDQLMWADGLVISLIATPGGLFSQSLPEADIPREDLEGMTDAQATKIRARQQDDRNEATEADMASYLRARLGEIEGVGCAIIEMPASLRGENLDPYQLGRRVLAQHKLLPKVVLSEDDGTNDKYRASVADCLRMLGVVPFGADAVPYVPAAIGVIQRNQTRDGSSRITAQSVPVAVRIREGQLEGALPNSSQSPEWKPYAYLVLDILMGAYERYTRRSNAENRMLFANYINDALDHLNRTDIAVEVFLDGATLRSLVPALQNGQLRFDTLTVGSRTYTPSDLPSLRLIRVNANADELPSYSHDNNSQWTGGLFNWDGATRTVYGAKKKPMTLKNDGKQLLQSRHDPDTVNPRSDRKHRKASALDELSAIFVQPNDDVSQLQLLAHRLRSQHTHYKDDTRLPFPLHELHALSKSINF
ncbi:RNaseH domain-containing protein [Pelagibius sp.]|uniref:RNaseH domain-containing protein n=1 Tax=Pelagibius sp. TaxID=1931238 RepID=UPI003BB0A692